MRVILRKGAVDAINGGSLDTVVGWHTIIYMLWFDIAQNSTYSPYLDTLWLSSATNQKFA
jgi:hypothetical protein